MVNLSHSKTKRGFAYLISPPISNNCKINISVFSIGIFIIRNPADITYILKLTRLRLNGDSRYKYFEYLSVCFSLKIIMCDI
jgi:hypothetical protein